MTTAEQRETAKQLGALNEKLGVWAAEALISQAKVRDLEAELEEGKGLLAKALVRPRNAFNTAWLESVCHLPEGAVMTTARQRAQWLEKFATPAYRGHPDAEMARALIAQVEQLAGLVDPAMWVVKNYEEWLDSPSEDNLGTLMAALADLAAYLAKKGA